MQEFITSSDEETQAIGRFIASRLPSGGIVLLTGELGAGKTTLAKGIIEGLNLASAEDVTSPTYTLIHEYGNPVRLYHVDLYRIESADQARKIGLDELIDSGALLLIEWGERFPELLPAKRTEIALFHVDDNRRRIRLHDSL